MGQGAHRLLAKGLAAWRSRVRARGFHTHGTPPSMACPPLMWWASARALSRCAAPSCPSCLALSAAASSAPGCMHACMHVCAHTCVARSAGCGCRTSCARAPSARGRAGAGRSPRLPCHHSPQAHHHSCCANGLRRARVHALQLLCCHVGATAHRISCGAGPLLHDLPGLLQPGLLHRGRLLLPEHGGNACASAPRKPPIGVLVR